MAFSVENPFPLKKFLKNDIQKSISEKHAKPWEIKKKGDILNIFLSRSNVFVYLNENGQQCKIFDNNYFYRLFCTFA